VSETLTFLDALAGEACADGGWGYAPGQPAHLEPTCLGLLALSGQPERFAAPIAAARSFLQRCLGPDGLYRLARGRTEAVWPTALVLWVRANLGDSPAELASSAAALLAIRGQNVAKNDDDINDIDFKLIGWPWAENNFAWVEPTAWAVLALRRLGQGDHPRVRDGMTLLLDRALDGGGVNYGNRRILGIALEPIPTPTALMLLAMQGQPPHPKITAAVAYLRDKALAGEDVEHLCWARLALDLYRDHEGVAPVVALLGERIRAALEVRTTVPWLRPAPLRLALACLALSVDQANPGRLPMPSRPRRPWSPPS